MKLLANPQGNNHNALDYFIQKTPHISTWLNLVHVIYVSSQTSNNTQISNLEIMMLVKPTLA